MRAPDPLERFHLLVADARVQIARGSYDQPGRTTGEVAEVVGRMYLAEGKVLGFLEALTLTRPDLALEAAAEAEKLAADVQAIMLTMPGARADEPFPEED